jgi:hypothetical protein
MREGSPSPGNGSPAMVKVPASGENVETPIVS